MKISSWGLKSWLHDLTSRGGRYPHAIRHLGGLPRPCSGGGGYHLPLLGRLVQAALELLEGWD